MIPPHIEENPDGYVRLRVSRETIQLLERANASSPSEAVRILAERYLLAESRPTYFDEIAMLGAKLDRLEVLLAMLVTLQADIIGSVETFEGRFLEGIQGSLEAAKREVERISKVNSPGGES